MEYDEERERYILATGRKLDANCGVIGIGPDGSLYEGFDGCYPETWFSDQEKREIARHMIEQWSKFLKDASST